MAAAAGEEEALRVNPKQIYIYQYTVWAGGVGGARAADVGAADRSSRRRRTGFCDGKSRAASKRWPRATVTRAVAAVVAMGDEDEE